jgi:Ca2+-binding EF-hand superfamily protein
MTLEELLALLPDNTTGEISAADMRTIVTELWNHATPAEMVSAEANES